MKASAMKWPLTTKQRECLNLGTQTVKGALWYQDSPFSQAVKAALGEELLEKVDVLIDKCADTVNHKDLYFDDTEHFPFYVLMHLTRHVFLSDYFIIYMKEMDIDVDADMERAKILKDTIYTFIDITFKSMKGFEVYKIFQAYLFGTRSLPDLVTGISHQLMAYNHIPNIPANHPQLDFRHYDNDEEIIYKMRGNHHEFLKNINCLNAFYMILRDKENPPAKILTAYFPNMKDYIHEVVTKIVVKDRRRKKVTLTMGEFGLLYACADLFGRLRASAYHNLAKDLMKGTMYEDLNAEIERNFIEEDNKSLLLTVVEVGLRRSNEDFGDCAVIKDYRALAAQMIGFDD
jgi:hypothetical protein